VLRLTPVAIALGSNLGDRVAHLQYAVTRLNAVLQNLRVSSLHETPPVALVPQPDFLNAAVVGTTSLTASALLEALLQIESEQGRERPFPDAPRTLDLDLVLFGDQIVDEADLQVPHPRFRDRAFVLAPLAEVAADWVDPVTRLTVGELLTRVGRG
jgi:2-amino-4-hydroxy-6-hydroxymethyldihydropteridine diphosphokinase